MKIPCESWGKYTCLILRCLLAGPRRFSEISEYIEGLSNLRMSQSLQEPEEEGIMQCQVLNRRPVVVEYSLIPKGLDFRKVAEDTQGWANECAGDTVTV